jgi:uncharacterized phiE125 gp8 family phage protein
MDKITVQPATEPITLTELRLQLGIMDSDATERDSVLTANITAARIWSEWFTQRAFITQSWGYYADAFPCARQGKPFSDAIDLKLDLQSIEFVKYVNESGILTTLDPAKYQVDLVSSRVMPAYGLTWPTTRAVPNAVQISYISGYADADAVPEDIKKALKIIAGQWENFQGALESGITVRSVAWAAIQLLSNYRDYRNIF